MLKWQRASDIILYLFYNSDKVPERAKNTSVQGKREAT